MKIALMVYFKNSSFCCGRVDILVGQEFGPTCCGLGIGLNKGVGFSYVKEVCCSSSFLPKPIGDKNTALWRVLDRAITKREWGSIGSGCCERFFSCGNTGTKVLMNFTGETGIAEFIDFAECCGVNTNKVLTEPTSDFWNYVKKEIAHERKNVLFSSSRRVLDASNEERNDSIELKPHVASIVPQ